MIDTPEKLGLFLSSENIPEKNRYASYLCKAYYDHVQELKKFYGFSYTQILKSVNSALELCSDNEIKYEAFRSSLRRIEKIRDGNSKHAAKPQDNEFRAHEKIENKIVETSKDVELSDEWLCILKDHPVMKKETIKRAINNGLTFEEAKNANGQGVRKFAEIVNIYCMRKLN